MGPSERLRRSPVKLGRSALPASSLRDLEARAGAFAAELLLPRAGAGEARAAGGDAGKGVDRLRRRFGVSPEVVAWQVRNSGIPLGPRVVAHLRSPVSEPLRI